MADDSKIVDRVRKLIRLANGNTTPGESSSAALEAAKMIHEHGLIVSLPARSAEPDPWWTAPQPAPAPKPRPWKPRAPSPAWHQARAKTSGKCSLCKKPIAIGDDVWAWMGGQIHDDCW